jgi:hypothetical protein
MIIEADVDDKVEDDETIIDDGKAGSGEDQKGAGDGGSKSDETVQSDAVAKSGEGKSDESDDKEYWPSDWRQQVAKHYANGNEKAYERELKRLERIKDPEGLFGMYREAETKISSNRAIFKPGKNATEEDKKAYAKALGVPEKAEQYLDDLKLANDMTLGEEDKESALAFAEHMHEVGAPKPVMEAALNWYYKQQEAAAYQQDEADDIQRYEADKALKEDFGSAFKRKTAGISSLFAQAPGGADVSNPESLYSRLVGGRLADGSLIGNDPDVVRWLVGLSGEVNPAATTLPDGLGSSQSVDEEIKEIEKIMRTDKRDYFKNHAGRYAELLSVREKMRGKQ